MDDQGNDEYIVGYFGQGEAFWGIAALCGHTRKRQFFDNQYAQGIGSVRGFDLLL